MSTLADALLPPAILPLLGLLLLLGGWPRAAAVAIAALVLFSVQAVPHLLTTPLLLPPAAGAAQPPGAIVVLASGQPELLDPSRTAPDLETLSRLRTAAALFRRTGAPILVSGARVGDGAGSVAAAMARSLETDFRVPVGWTEPRSTNLWQSAADSAAILRRAGIGDVYLVAQPWEMRLSASVFRSAGLAVTPEAVPRAAPLPLGFGTLLALTSSWVDSAVALAEWAGLACQAAAPCATWMRGADAGR